MRSFVDLVLRALLASALALLVWPSPANADCGPSDPGVPTICSSGSTDIATATKGKGGRITTSSPSDPGIPD